jgi:hypothetical protein
MRRRTQQSLRDGPDGASLSGWASEWSGREKCVGCRLTGDRSAVSAARVASAVRPASIALRASSLWCGCRRGRSRSETLVDETWAGDKDTRSAYDEHGNASERQTDGSWATPEGSAPRYEAGKATSYAYDPLDRERETHVTQAGEPGARTTRTDYHPSGEPARKVKPNGVNEYTSFASDGRLSHEDVPIVVELRATVQ